MVLNVREILCNELLLDLKSELLIFLQATPFSSPYIGLFTFCTISQPQKIFQKKGFLFFIKTGQFPRILSMNWRI